MVLEGLSGPELTSVDGNGVQTAVINEAVLEDIEELCTRFGLKYQHVNKE